MEAATYLSDLLDIDYNRCYKFSAKHEFNQKEELLEKYFNNPKLLWGKWSFIPSSHYHYLIYNYLISMNNIFIK